MRKFTLAVVSLAGTAVGLVGCHGAPPQSTPQAPTITTVKPGPVNPLKDAEAAMQKGDWEGARQGYTAELNDKNGNPAFKSQAQSGIGNTYLMQQKFDQARQAYNQLAAEPGASGAVKAQAQMSVAQTYLAQGNMAQARAEYAKVATIQDVPPATATDAELGVALTYLNENNFSAAKAEYQKVIHEPKVGKAEKDNAIAQTGLVDKMAAQHQTSSHKN